MRITPRHTVNTAIDYSRTHSAQLARLQAQISSGLRIHKPSDAPGDLAQLLSNKANVERIEVDVANIESVRSKLNQSVAQLLSAKEAFTRATSAALQGVQASEPERIALAQQIDGILELMLQVANSTDGRTPLYAGTRDTRQPFTVDRRSDDGRIQSVKYDGSDQRARIVVGVRLTVDSLYTGAEIFRSTARQATQFVGTTGAQPGQGTDSAAGQGTLLVEHSLTTFAGGSGLQSASSPSSQDTALGTRTLTVDGVNNTLQFDGGLTVNFVKGDTVTLRASDGAVIHVDTTAFVDGFSGAVTVSGEGTLSIDGGLSRTAIDFSANQVVTHSETGEVTNVDTTAVRKSGSDHVEYLGTSDVFQSLIALRNELLNTRGLTGSQSEAAMQRRIGDIEQSHDHLLSVIAEQSSSLENLDALENRVRQYKLETQQVVDSLESTDLPEAILKLQAEQNALQYTYAVSVRLMDTSILDFLT